MKIIPVTQKHIKNGRQNDARLCPIALAIRDKYSNIDTLFVETDEICIDYNYYKPSKSVIRFIKKFDKYGEKAVAPFNFKLRQK